jgi:hypothetical protein
MIQSLETQQERRTRYLHYAAEARNSSCRCNDPRLRDAYLQIAESWVALAREFAVPANDDQN